MYKRTAIRQYFVSLLKAGVTSVSSRVYGGRINPKNDENYPYLNVIMKDEDIENQFTGHTTRDLTMHIGVFVKNNTINDGDFDAITEALMYDVESIMGKVLTVQAKQTGDNFALLNDIVVVGTSTSTDNSSGDDLGVGVLTYKINYSYELPIKPITLEDFDWLGSIQHMQITNEGIPVNDV